MAGNNDAEVRVGITGQLYAAPVGTTLPTAYGEALDAAFVDLGYLSDEDPVAMDTERDTETIGAWQTPHPVRTLVTRSVNPFTFRLRQRNTETMLLSFGGTVVTDGADGTVYTPGNEPIERALTLDVLDGTVTDRYVIARAKVTAVGTVTISKSAATDLEITVSPQEDSAFGGAWKLYSNDPALAAS